MFMGENVNESVWGKISKKFCERMNGMKQRLKSRYYNWFWMNNFYIRYIFIIFGHR